MPLPRPAPGTTKWWVVGTIGIGLGIALAVWFGLSATVGQPTWQTTGYQVEGPESVRVDFQVHSPGGRPLRCSVQALAKDFSIVGSVDVEVAVPASEEARRSVTVRTTSMAVTGQVDSCVQTG